MIFRRLRELWFLHVTMPRLARKIDMSPSQHERATHADALDAALADRSRWLALEIAQRKHDICSGRFHRMPRLEAAHCFTCDDCGWPVKVTDIEVAIERQR